MKKLTSKKGFTLMEMLIVVAIIAVLVAVSIPVFTAQLEKSREATDTANERAAKAEIVATYLTWDSTDAATSTNLATLNTTAGTLTGYYDAVNGQLKAAATGIEAYGKGTKAGKNANVHTDKIIEVTYATATGAVTYKWGSGTTFTADT